MENEDIVKNPKELADRLARAIANKEAFSINATFTTQDGQVSSVFFVGGKITSRDLVAHIESLNAMIKALNGQQVPAENFIKKTDKQTYEKHADGSFTLNLNPNDQAPA